MQCCIYTKRACISLWKSNFVQIDWECDNFVQDVLLPCLVSILNRRFMLFQRDHAVMAFLDMQLFRNLLLLTVSYHANRASTADSVMVSVCLSVCLFCVWYRPICVNKYFIFTSLSTRGHPYKLYKTQCENLKRCSFLTERIVNVWNSLPATVDFSTLPRFKRSIAQVDFSQFLKCNVL